MGILLRSIVNTLSKICISLGKQLRLHLVCFILLHAKSKFFICFFNYDQIKNQK